MPVANIPCLLYTATGQQLQMCAYIWDIYERWEEKTITQNQLPKLYALAFERHSLIAENH